MVNLTDLYNAQIDTGLTLLGQIEYLLDQMPEALPDGSNISYGHLGKLIGINHELSQVSYDLHKHLELWSRKESERNASPHS